MDHEKTCNPNHSKKRQKSKGKSRKAQKPAKSWKENTEKQEKHQTKAHKTERIRVLMRTAKKGNKTKQQKNLTKEELIAQPRCQLHQGKKNTKTVNKPRKNGIPRLAYQSVWLSRNFLGRYFSAQSKTSKTTYCEARLWYPACTGLDLFNAASELFRNWCSA